MKKPKPIKTEPIYGGFTGNKIGKKYIYDKQEVMAYKEYLTNNEKRLGDGRQRRI